MDHSRCIDEAHTCNLIRRPSKAAGVEDARFETFPAVYTTRRNLPILIQPIKLVPSLRIAHVAAASNLILASLQAGRQMSLN